MSYFYKHRCFVFVLLLPFDENRRVIFLSFFSFSFSLYRKMKESGKDRLTLYIGDRCDRCFL